MDENGLFIASLLDATSKTLAAGAVLREGVEPGGGFEVRVADAQRRIAFLAESLAAGEPGLVRIHAEWSRDAHLARRGDAGILARQFECLLEELEENLPPEAFTTAAAHLGPALDAVRRTPPAPEGGFESAIPAGHLAGRFLLAQLEGRRAQALGLVLEAQRAGQTLATIHQEILAPAQAELGRMWQRGELGISGEHLGSRMVEDALVLLRAALPDPAPDAPRALVGSVPGDLHAIGARMVGDQLEEAGWFTLFLGADVPGADVAHAVEEFGASLVTLSVSQGIHIRSAAECIGAIREHAPSAPAILVGGQPFRALPELWRKVGADGCAATADEAVRFAARLVG